jgi:hydrogenase nickel incorporation protein HypA/HybF
MHELSVAVEILEIVAEGAKGGRVKKVTVEIGKLAAVLPAALLFSFSLAAEGTPAEGAELEIVEKDGTARCRACASNVALASVYGHCSCGSAELDWLTGTELRVLSMEVL